MSKISLVSNSSGSGTFSIASPNTNSDRTLTLPDSTGTIATAESTLAQFSASGSAPVFACRAWVNFNGTGTVAIRASGNVSSITDNGTGDYTVNFTTAMPDADYVVTTALGGSTIFGTDLTLLGATAPTSSAIRIGTRRTSDGILLDPTYVNVAIFR